MAEIIIHRKNSRKQHLFEINVLNHASHRHHHIAAATCEAGNRADRSHMHFVQYAQCLGAAVAHRKPLRQLNPKPQATPSKPRHHIRSPRLWRIWTFIIPCLNTTDIARCSLQRYRAITFAITSTMTMNSSQTLHDQIDWCDIGYQCIEIDIQGLLQHLRTHHDEFPRTFSISDCGIGP